MNDCFGHFTDYGDGGYISLCHYDPNNQPTKEQWKAFDVWQTERKKYQRKRKKLGLPFLSASYDTWRKEIRKGELN